MCFDPKKFAQGTVAAFIQVRDKLGVSQPMFARLLCICQKTLQNSEQGRRKPTGPAKVPLRVAARHPKLLLDAVK